jgi:hypothetical protein
VSIFLLLLAIVIAIPSMVKWSRIYKSTDLFSVKPFKNYWQNVRVTAPLGLIGVAFIIGGGAFHPEQSMSRLFGLAFLCLMFFPTALLYFHCISWLSEKFWVGSGLSIHIGLIGVATYFTNGRDLANSIDSVVYLIIFLFIAIAIRWFFRRMKGILS